MCDKKVCFVGSIWRWFLVLDCWVIEIWVLRATSVRSDKDVVGLGWGVRNGGRSFGGGKNEKKWELKSFWAGSGSYWNVLGSSVISTFLTPFVRQEKEKAFRIKDTWNTSGVHVHCKCLLMCLCFFVGGGGLSSNFREDYYVTAIHDLDRNKKGYTLQNKWCI